jgi:hypothetical protein
VVVRSIGRSPQPTRPGTIDALATKGAPLMAPLLFSNMGLVGLVALLPEREHVG